MRSTSLNIGIHFENIIFKPYWTDQNFSDWNTKPQYSLHYRDIEQLHIFTLIYCLTVYRCTLRSEYSSVEKSFFWERHFHWIILETLTWGNEIVRSILTKRAYKKCFQAKQKIAYEIFVLVWYNWRYVLAFRFYVSKKSIVFQWKLKVLRTLFSSLVIVWRMGSFIDFPWSFPA